ncbi:MAG: tyrosine-type recombinase/integrase [Sphingobacteriales bacterium]
MGLLGNSPRPASPRASGARHSLNGRNFCRCSGRWSPLSAAKPHHQWHLLLAKNKALPRIRFHDLRHAHATHMLSSGVHPKIDSERLGHSKVGITMDLYSHVMPGMQEDAAARVDRDL